MDNFIFQFIFPQLHRWDTEIVRQENDKVYLATAIKSTEIPILLSKSVQDSCKSTIDLLKHFPSLSTKDALILIVLERQRIPDSYREQASDTIIKKEIKVKEEKKKKPSLKALN
jgi:hypothetical protein